VLSSCLILVIIDIPIAPVFIYFPPCGYFLSLFIFFGLLAFLMKTLISRWRSEIRARKYKKGPENMTSMENKLNKTGADFGKHLCLPKLRNHELNSNSVCRKESSDRLQRINWSNPEASKQLIKELLQLVNTRAEYELLKQELSEIERLFSSSLLLKGGAAKTAVK
jgi:hypothetical protein